MTGNERPDIYADGLRVRVRAAPGVRAPHAGARQVQLLGVAMSGWDELGREQDMAAARAVGYLEGMYDVAVVRKRVA